MRRNRQQQIPPLRDATVGMTGWVGVASVNQHEAVINASEQDK